MEKEQLNLNTIMQAQQRKQQLMQQAQQAFEKAQKDMKTFLTMAGNDKLPGEIRLNAWNNASAISSKISPKQAYPAMDTWDDVSEKVTNTLGVLNQQLAKGEIKEDVWNQGLRTAIDWGMKSSPAAKATEGFQQMVSGASQPPQARAVQPDLPSDSKETMESLSNNVNEEDMDEEVPTIHEFLAPEEILGKSKEEQRKMLEEKLNADEFLKDKEEQKNEILQQFDTTEDDFDPDSFLNELDELERLAGTENERLISPSQLKRMRSYYRKEREGNRGGE